MALKYWTTWNLCWALAEHNKIVPYTNSLHTCLITTSIMGAYTVYTNSEACIIRIGKKRWKPNKISLILGDILLHHLPLIIALKYKKNKNIKGCGRYGILPVFVWYGYVNYFYNPHKIYNKNIHGLLLTAISVYMSQGYIRHR